MGILDTNTNQQNIFVNNGRIGPDEIVFLKSAEVKMSIVYLIWCFACIILVWFGCEFLRTKQVTRGSPGIGPLIFELFFCKKNTA